jgi:hypothetical protein
VTSDPIARYLTQRSAKMDKRNRLRIMTGNEVIDVAIRVYQALGWTFLRLTVVPSLFCLAAVTFFLRYVWPQYFQTKNAHSESGQLIEMASTTGLAFFVAAPLFILGISYISVIVTRLVSDYMLGNVPSAAAAESRARKLLMNLFWLNVRETLLASGGFLVSLGLLALASYLGTVTSENDATAGVILIVAWLGIIGGGVVFLAVISRHALAPAIMTLEDASIGESAKRSATLLKSYARHGSGAGSVWTLYFLLMFLWLMVGGGIAGSLALIGYPENVRALVNGLPFAPIVVAAIGLVPSFLVIWTLSPVWAATTTIIYYDRRIRLEGYDIEALAEDVWRADRSRRFDV